jgi:hypothetical protein
MDGAGPAAIVDDGTAGHTIFFPLYQFYPLVLTIFPDFISEPAR